MDKLPNFVSMARSPEEIQEDGGGMLTVADQPLYPWGLKISLSEEELEKLDLDDDVAVGDTLHMFCLVRVTSVSKNETENGTCQRIELQITDIACEDEDDENEAADEGLRRAVNFSRLYKK